MPATLEAPAPQQQTRTAVKTRLLVGLEIHVQLATDSKMFTAAKNGFGGEPNTQVDPMVMGLPGTLPVMNRRAVELAMTAGLALGCEVARECKWDRKSYYYPDLPKNYQISQYDQPLCGEGVYMLTLPDGGEKTVRIRRAHLEEDAGKLLHDAPGGYAIDYSIVDLNRAGTPLLEIVTEPDFDAPETVAAFARELQQLVQYLGVSEGQMQMGHMRFEPNINVHITDESGQVHKTAITEVKNLNSFSVLEKSVAYEARRQVETWERTGDLGKKATYGWDEARQATVLQREKEEAHDYRYFPDPDLVPVVVDDAWLEELKGRIGELPAARRKRYAGELGLNDQVAGDLSQHKPIGDYFDAVVRKGADAKRAAVLVETLREAANDARIAFTDLSIAPARVAEIAALVSDSKIQASKETGRKVIDALLEKDQSAEAAASELGLMQSSDTGEIDAAVDAVLASNPKPLQQYRDGKQAALGALIGMVMKQGQGLNPKLVQERLKAKL